MTPMMIQATIACICLLMSPSPPDNCCTGGSLSRQPRDPNMLRVRGCLPGRSSTTPRLLLDPGVGSAAPRLLLDVDHAAVRRQHALMHHLGEGRVREDAVDHLFLGRLEVH